MMWMQCECCAELRTCSKVYTPDNSTEANGWRGEYLCLGCAEVVADELAVNLDVSLV